MHCSDCRAEIPTASRFCLSCGSPVAILHSPVEVTTEATKLASPTPVDGAPRSPAAGWLSASGSIDHGRFQPGSLLGDRYRVIGLIGRGGMGEVYRADDLRLGQAVALKFLPQSLTRDAARLSQFHGEVRTARQVSHPNVCRVYDIGEVDGQLFLSMEYVDGEDLANLLRRIGRLPEDKALEIARQICAGLAAAHERGVLHRDLKPANIMLDGAGKVRLMDFGLATAGPVTDVRAGTPAYMAPEQLEGREVTVRSDIFSLGLVLYELFTGRRTFQAATLADLVLQHASHDITAPTEIVKTLDPAIERAILRCLVSEPLRRPASVVSVAAALPGGDPLAAAIAAGETPSPELVAAAGDQAAALTIGQGFALFISVLVLLALEMTVQPVASMTARVQITKARPVLVDRAETLRRTFGYTAAALDSESGYSHHNLFLNWAFRRGAGADRYSVLSLGRPTPIRFWYRSSPNVMVPINRAGAVTLIDPPLSAGMTRIDLDPAGRMFYFEGVTTGREEPRETNWDALFEAAQLDRARFTEAGATFRPPSFADERRAWRGNLPELPDVPVEIQAAAHLGVPVLYRVVLEPDVPIPATGGIAVDAPNAFVRFVGLVLFAALPIVAALLARRNMRLGRSDRRGAFRLWAFLFATNVVAWIIAPEHVADSAEVDRMFVALGIALFWSGVAYLAYLALEPYVRRTSPAALITWSRLLGGRITDPLVGRDLLVGTVVGISVALTEPAIYLLPRIFGWPESLPYRQNLAPLFGYRETFAMVARLLFDAMLPLMQGAFLLALVRHWLLRLARGRGVSWPGHPWVASAIVIAVFAMIVMRTAVDATYPLLDVASFVVTGSIILSVIQRLGLFAGIVAFFVFFVSGSVPWTVDPSNVYSGPVFAVAALLIAMAATGFWLARAGEPLFAHAEADG